MAILNRFSAILLYCDSTPVLLLAAEFLAIPGPRFLRAACLQNETVPEKVLNRYEKRFEKREKGSEKRCAFEKCLAPLRPLKNISPALFNKF